MTTPTTNNNTKEERQRQLMEAWIKCGCSCHRPYYMTAHTDDCSTPCKATGKLYPLRKKCPGCRGCPKQPQWLKAAVFPHMDVCQGRGFVYSGGYDKLLEFCRAKRWYVLVQTYVTRLGNSILIQNSVRHTLATNALDSDLFGTDALETAIVRALEKEAQDA